MSEIEPKEYWEALLKYMRREGMLVTYREAYKDNRQVIDDWKGNTLDAGLNFTEGWVHVDITLRGPHREGYFASLEKERDRLEGEVVRETSCLNNEGSFWIWEKYPDPTRKESHIIFRKPVNLADRTDWEKQYEWLGKVAVAFRGAFGSKIKRWEGLT